MAYGIHILAKINPSDKEEIVIEPAWWDVREIWKAHDFIQTGNYAYTDYIWKPKKDELVELLKSQEKYLNEGIYSIEQWVKNNNETIVEINDLLENLNENSDLKVRIFEWDY